ncbi:TPA: hypothetical protein SAP37_003741 [Burkholderia multivorans]|uniref:hypothetical protein n=2 Tax=Burkholderia multivorans TaxID=87883 RepID=UPI001C211B5C|nr:hypothetical protein [Burkholderia multivorans]MBU9585920.1 hypothetical protein [Burkholderia multivorans]HEF4778594.1 hypothetical protein [Burkholderia multivorans]HEF4825929.1 hypothetical protein [Burkholderia multivorans]
MIDHRHAVSPSALPVRTVTVIRMTRIAADAASHFSLSFSGCRVQLHTGRAHSSVNRSTLLRLTERHPHRASLSLTDCGVHVHTSRRPRNSVNESTPLQLTERHPHVSLTRALASHPARLSPLAAKVSSQTA